jgi:putative hydrolase of the HAD superfamily
MESKKFAALAFDLDGTLYPNYRFYIRLVPFLFKELRLLRAFGKARNRLRAGEGKEGGENFYGRQARLMAEILNEPPEELEEKVRRLIYRGWEPIFKKIKLYSHAEETLTALKAAGIKLGLLSDFPPEEKLKNLGIFELWDTVLCSEILGELKPDPLPFVELARRMGLPPEKILYVGNSFSYDVEGAKKAGMGAAWIKFGRKNPTLKAGVKAGVKTGAGAGGPPAADFVFSDYRQLRDYVLI